MTVSRVAACWAVAGVALVCGCRTASGHRPGAVHHGVVCWLKATEEILAPLTRKVVVYDFVE